MTAAVIHRSRPFREACELRRKLVAPLALAMALSGWLGVHDAAAQAHEPVPAAADEHAQPAEHAAAEHEGAAEHGLSALLWPVANFLVLAGALYYFMRTPFAEYLAARSAQVRKELVEAGELNRTATAQLAEVDRKLKALPGEITQLKQRGVEEIAAEEERIASAAAADRARLLTQTRREIDVRLQAAQRELSDHAATLALQLAEQRLGREMSPADHTRLVDRYVHQVKEG